MRDVAIGLMARYPRIGAVKTRLARSVGDECALTIYRSLLFQSVNLVTSLDSVGILRTVFVTPTEDCHTFESEYPGFDSYFKQQGANLGERMQQALGTLLSVTDIRSAVLIGTDCPGLKAEHIQNAVSLLNSHNLVLGPATDGGYYLVGLRKIQPELFSEIKWGTSKVMKETLVVARSLNLNTGLLPKLRDLDNKQDLDHFDQMGLI